MRALTENDIEMAVRHYRYHQRRTKGRVDKLGVPIKFKMSFVEWLSIWLESGHFFERGTGRGQYVMSRRDDIGDYDVGNVFIQLATQNVSDAQKGKVLDDELRAILSNVKVGTKLSYSHKEAISSGLTGKEHDIITCHCGKSGGNRVMKRWHFQNCKLINHG